MGEGGNQFTVKSVIPREEVEKCSVNFVELEPGNYVYGYHICKIEGVFLIVSKPVLVRLSCVVVCRFYPVHYFLVNVFDAGQVDFVGTHCIGGSDGF